MSPITHSWVCYIHTTVPHASHMLHCAVRFLPFPPPKKQKFAYSLTEILIPKVPTGTMEKWKLPIILPISTHTHTHNHFMALWILSRITKVSQSQKKYSATHTYSDHQSSFICFLHLLRSMASSLFNLCTWQYFYTIPVHAFFGVHLGLASFTSYISSPKHCLLFAPCNDAIVAMMTLTLGRRLLLGIGKQWYQLHDFIQYSSNSGLHSCISISINNMSLK